MSDDRDPFIASASQTIGPFFHFGPGAHPQLGTLVTPSTRGERIRLEVEVLDGDGAPVTDALIEIWQADADGRFQTGPPGSPRSDAFHGFGRLPTQEDGRCVFDTIRPGAVSKDDAAHVNLCVFMRGLLRHVYTRLYFAGDPALDHDAVLGLVPSDRRDTLVAQPDASEAGRWRFVIRLQGDQETVFFDL